MSKGAIWAIVICVAVVVLGVVAAFLGLLGWAHESGEELQRTFFAAVLSGDANRVTALFDPSLQAEVDEPILAQWMAVFKTNLGELKGLSKTNFNTSTNVTSAGRFTQTSGQVNFEKGDANSELKFKDGKIVAFDIVSGKMKNADWLKLPAAGDRQLYRDRGKQFLTFFLTDKPEDASAMMHKSLRDAAPMEKLKKMMADVAAQTGAMKSVEYLSEEPGPSDDVKILYKVQGEKASTVASVKFQLDGMKLSLLAFKLNEKAERPAPASTRPAPK